MWSNPTTGTDPVVGLLHSFSLKCDFHNLSVSFSFIVLYHTKKVHTFAAENNNNILHTKNQMKKLNINLTIVIIAATTVFGFTSCNKDDCLDDLPFNKTDNNPALTRTAIQDPNIPDPFRGGVTYHFGDKVMKNIDNYGMAEWTCISDQAPYYFIHVSDKKYSMSEKDNMHYAQSEYAATKEKLEEVGKLMVPHIVQWTPIFESIENKHSGTKSYRWLEKDVDNMAKNELSKFIPIVETNTNSTITISNNNITYSRSGDCVGILSEEFWIVNSHDYPYAVILWKVYGNNIPATQNIWEHPENSIIANDAHHWSYASPCNGHRYFFIKKVDR